MKTNKIDVKCGIYETEYTIRDYGKKIVVTSPYIKWVNNSGNLDFTKITYKSAVAMKHLREMVENDCLVTEDMVTMGELERMYN